MRPSTGWGERSRTLTTTATETLSRPKRAQPRVGAIDGVRGIAIAAVLGYHAAPSLVTGGFLGVEVFFVLSGYLLTSLLLDEHRRTGVIDWHRYVLRRVRRLGPVLALFLMALVVIGPLVAGSDAHRLRDDVFWSALGLTNWHLLVDGSSYFGSLGRPPLVRHLWSLAIEIQFYALIPFLVTWVVRQPRQRALVALGGGLAASSLLMGLLYQAGNPSRAYYGTDARLGGLLTGMFLAVALARSPGAASLQPRRGLSLVDLGALAGLVVLMVFVDDRARFAYPFGFLACRLATAMVVSAALEPGPVAAALSTKALRWLGVRSYSIYLWHWPLIVLLRPGLDVSWPPAVARGVAVLGGLVLGHLSYLVAERPFIRSRRRAPAAAVPSLQRVVRWAALGTAVLGVVALAARLPTVDPLAERLKAGQRALAARPVTDPTTTTTTLPPAPTTTVAPPPSSVPPAEPPVTAPPPTTPPPTAPPPAPPPTALQPLTGPLDGPPSVVIGDSVLLSAVDPLVAWLPPNSYIDATLSRQFRQGVDLARQLREEGRLGQSVIVHLGTNGPPRSRDIDALMVELATVPHVRLVTVRMPQPWQDATNQTLREAPARHPSVQVVDWYAYSEGHREWFESDGTHVKRTGARAYAELLVRSLPTNPPPATTTTAPPVPAPPPEPAPPPGPPPTVSSPRRGPRPQKVRRSHFTI